ncbi:MAG: DMT family transporter [Alphaproteobacteria bacterium]
MAADAAAMPAETPGSGRGLVLVAASALLWSSGGLIVRLLDSADSWTTIFWRSASACLFLLGFLALRDGRAAPALFRRMGAPGLVVAAGFACASISFVVALSLTSVAETLMIMSSAPLIAALLGRAVLGEPISPATWLTIAAVMLGIALIAADALEHGSLLGDAFALASACGYSAAIVAIRRHPQVRMTPAVCTGAACAMLIALPFATPLAVTAHDAPLLALFGAGQLGLGLALFVTGARLIPAAHSALIGLLEPVLGPVWVWLAFAERPTALALVGGTIVIAGVTANTVHGLRRRKRRLPAG